MHRIGQSLGGTQWVRWLGLEGSTIVEKPAHGGAGGEAPSWLEPKLLEALQRQGYGRLYIHQIEAITAAAGGEDIILTTPTASGKSLAFQIRSSMPS